MLQPKATIFISDLHLSAQRPDLTELFINFLQGPAQSAHTLYILGDLFDVWVGADIDADFHQLIAQHIAKLHHQGITVYFMVGNRDFLIHPSFLKRASMQLLRDPTVIDLEGTPTVLTHGDTLCSHDIAYQRYRMVAQNPLVKCLFRMLPRKIRQNIAQKLRLKSQQYQKGQQLSMLDVTVSAVQKMAAQFGVQQMIHGHVHRPAFHENKGLKRMVSGDWGKTASFIQSSPTECFLAEYDPLAQKIKIVS